MPQGVVGQVKSGHDLSSEQFPFDGSTSHDHWRISIRVQSVLNPWQRSRFSTANTNRDVVSPTEELATAALMAAYRFNPDHPPAQTPPRSAGVHRASWDLNSGPALLYAPGHLSP